MVAKKKPIPPVTITGCTFAAEAGKVSPEVARAVEALANASARHAEALAAGAKALQGAPGILQTGIRVGGGDV